MTAPILLENLHERFGGKVWVQTSLLQGHRTGEMDRGDVYLRLEGEVSLLTGPERVELFKQGIASLRRLMPQLVPSTHEEAEHSFIQRTSGLGVLWFKLP